MQKLEIELTEATREDLASHLREIADLLVDHIEYEEGECWWLSEIKVGEVLSIRGLIEAEPLAGPRAYICQVTCEQLVADGELDYDDQHDGPCSEEHYRITAYSREGAHEAALDVFHESNAIACLDDYNISVEVKLDTPEKAQCPNLKV